MSDIEKNISKCKVCQTDKPKNLIGKFDLKNKKYTDDTGKLWSGHTCPDCHKKKQADLQRIRRATKKVVSDGDTTST